MGYVKLLFQRVQSLYPQKRPTILLVYRVADARIRLTQSVVARLMTRTYLISRYQSGIVNRCRRAWNAISGSGLSKRVLLLSGACWSSGVFLECSWPVFVGRRAPAETASRRRLFPGVVYVDSGAGVGQGLLSCICMTGNVNKTLKRMVI